MLVVGTLSHSQSKGPVKACLQDLGLLLNSWSKEQDLPGARLHCAPSPKCLNRNAFLPDGLWCQDVWQQPFLLTLIYARGLQYWAERLNPPDGSNFCPLAESVVELKEIVKEHVVSTYWDLFRDLGRFDPMATSQGSQTSSSSKVMPPLGDEPSEPDPGSLTATGTEPARHTTYLARTEVENWYLLVVTTSIGQLSLEPSSKGLEGSLTAQCGGDIFRNPWMEAVLSAPTRVVNYGGAPIEELKEWCKNRSREWLDNCHWLVRQTHYHFWVGKWIDNCLWADGSTEDHLWAERIWCHWAVTILIVTFNKP